MAQQLPKGISLAVEQDQNAEEFATAIVELAKCEMATATLLCEYRNAVLDAERLWRELEAQPDYHYACRADAYSDYLRRNCK